MLWKTQEQFCMYPQELRKNSPYNNHQYQSIYYPFNIYGCLH